MTNSNKKTFDLTLIEAGKWIARENAGDMTNLEKLELENLLANNIDFQLAYLEIYKSANLIDSLATQGGKDTLCVLAPELLNLVEECEDKRVNFHEKQKPIFRFSGWVSSVAAVILIITVSFFFFFQVGSLSTIYQTKVGGTETVMLKDGSVITLNTDTLISVALVDTERRVLLEHGEAYFDVAKDKSRPFIVLVGDKNVMAVGTSFNIKHRTGATNVTVTEGIVKVENNLNASTQPIYNSITLPVSLVVGEGLTMDQEGVRTDMLAPLELEHTISWRKGMLHFNSERLDTVIREIQYYARKEIILSGSHVSEIIVGGSFNTNNVESFLKGLELNFPIKVIEREKVIIISYKQKHNEILSVSN